MYARGYKDGEITSPPPRYDGVAFMKDEQEPSEDTTQNENCAAVSASADTGVLGRLFGTDILRGFKFSKIGTEEILLIAAAAFLFFSKDGDKECAILLLILVFLA